MTFRVSDPFGASDEKDVVIKVDPRIDLQNFHMSPVANNEAVFSWHTDISAICAFEYWLTPAQKIVITTSFSPQQDHQVQLQNVIRDTTYHFRITANDIMGKVSVLVDSVFILSDQLAAKNQVIVYPNPVKPEEGHKNIIVTNLPQSAREFVLYNLFGEPVFNFSLANTGGKRAIIPVAELEKQRLSSGFYLYVIRDDKSSSISKGKLVYIR